MAFRSFSSDATLSRRGILRAAAFGGAGAFLAGCTGARGLLAQGAPKIEWNAVRAIGDRYVSQRKIANYVAAIGFGQQDPEYLYRGPLSIGGNVPAGPDSLYRIYSMTKPVTGVAASMLIDAGKLELDQPLKDILPAFADMQVLTSPTAAFTSTVPAERDITIRQLLTHTAGLGYNIIQSGPIRDAYNRAGIVPGQVSRLPIPGQFSGRPAPSLAIFADRLAKLPLVYQPGTRWSYSVSLDLMGRVIEVVSGQPFDSFLRDNIFGPARMDSTYFTVPQSEVDRLTTNYGFVAGNLIPIDPARSSIYLDKPEFPFGGAGLVSSPRDYDRFNKMLVGYGAIEGRRVVSENAIRIATSNLLPEGVSLASTWMGGGGYGAGGSVGAGGQEGTYGWAGAAGTAAMVNMKTGLRAGLFVQYMPTDAQPLRADFMEALAKDIEAARAAMKVAA